MSKTLTGDELQQLLRGHSFLESELSEDQMRPLWERHQDFCMSLTGKNVRKIVPGFALQGIVVPWGSRCYAWWLFEAPEPRRILAGDPAATMPEYGYSFGRPKLYKSLGAYNALVFESQPDFLRRHRLLLPGEAEKIRPGLIDR